MNASPVTVGARRRAALGAVGVAVLAVALVSIPTAPVQASSQTVDDVPVAGTFRYHAGQRDTRDDVVGVVHAVRRVPGGTAVYYSVGLTGSTTSDWLLTQPSANLDGYGPYDLRSVGVVDTTNLRYYRPMQAGRTCLCSQTTDLQREARPRVLLTGFAVVPELPADVRSVAVSFGFGAQVEDVPVEDGALTPTNGDGSTITPLGAGWPALPDDSVIASVASPDQYVLPLTRSVADLDRSLTTKEAPDHVEVDLAADVLFAVDKATLSDAASARLQQVAREIADRGTGIVTIVGYTDSTGSTSHNLTLSRARAASVLKALKPLVGKPGITFTSTGKGESEPVADNGTDDGRRLNRRVTITFGVAR
ncbi:MAG TPA: OmpA family protein [Actinomycetales bacterium]|nr:OmpA family protein [Actinomycetales bacterium]